MSNRFGINSASTTGDNNPPVADAPEAEATQKPFTGLNFNSVVSNSFNDALANADAVNKNQALAPKPDNSSILSMGGNVVTGFGGGLAEQVTSIFKKDKATLAREAELGSASSLSAGHSTIAAFTRTAGDVATALPAINPLSSEGRKNIGTLGNKWWAGLTTGTGDERAHFVGTNLSFVATLGVGGGSTVKGAGTIVRDLRGGTIASRALSLGDNFATATDDLGRATQNIARTTETSVVKTPHMFYPAKPATTVLETVTAPVVRTIDALPFTGPKASTLPILSQERLVIKSWSQFYPGARPANLTSAAITDASKGIAANATKDFTEALTRVIPKNAGETSALQELRTAAQKLATGGPEAQSSFLQAIKNTGTHADDLMAHGNALVRNFERAGAIENFGVVVTKSVDDISTKLNTLGQGVAKGSPEASALEKIRTLAADVASGGNKTDELIQAVNTLKREAPALKPQLVDELIADVAKLEGAATGRRLLVSFERSVGDVNEAAIVFQKSLQDARTANVAAQSGSEVFRDFDKLKLAADKFAHGGMSSDEFAAIFNKVKNSGIPEKELTTLLQSTAQLTERVHVTKLFNHMDEMVRPVKTATSELDTILMRAGSSPEQVAKVQQAVADFVAGRTGNSEELTAALRNLATSERNAAVQAGRSLDDAAKLADDLNAQVGNLVRRVEDARPALTLERSVAESTPILEEAARKFANKPAQLEAINEVKAAFSGALKGNVTADELAQVVSRHSKVLDNAVAGSSKTLTVNGTRIADASVDASRAIAIKNGVTDLGRASDEVFNAVKKLKEEAAAGSPQAKPLQNLEDAISKFKATENPSQQLTRDLQTAIDDARKANVPFSPTMQDFASKVERTSRLQTLEASVAKSRQASNGITATTDLMEAAVRQADEFQNIDRLRNAVRSGDRAAIADAIEASKAGLTKLDEIQPGLRKLVDDVDQVVKAGGTPTNNQLTKLTEALQKAEISAQRLHPEFRVLDDIRAAARRVSADGVGEDLASVIQKNKSTIDSMQLKVAGMEARIATTEARATNVAQRLGADAEVLAQEAATVRRLTQIENSSRSMTSLVENLAPKLDDVAKQTVLKSRDGGTQLVNDIREVAKTMPEGAVKTNLERKADELAAMLKAQVDNAAAPAINHASERLNIIKSLSDDVARGTIKEDALLSFVKKSPARLDDIAPGTAALVESKAAAIADARKLAVAQESIGVVRNAPNLADEAARLGFKVDSEVHKLATDFTNSVRNFANSGGSIAEVNAAAKKLIDFKPAVAMSADEASKLASLKASAAGLEKSSNDIAIAIGLERAAIIAAANSRNVSSYSTALNHIANLYDIAPPLVRKELMRVRESLLDHQAARLIAEQGFYGPKTLAQKAFGGVDAGESLISKIKAGSFNPQPIAGLQTTKSQVLDAAERLRNRIILDNQEKYSVMGLLQDRVKLLANPTVAQEVRQRELLRALVEVTAGVSLLYMGGSALKEKAQDVLYDELNAPYKIAEWMEKEISAKTDGDRQRYRAELAAMIADHIRDKDQSEIDALREQIKNIIAERTAENPEAQAVWTRKKEALSVSQLRINKEHDNQVQYGNPHGPNIGPGAPAAVQEASQQVIVTPAARVRSTAVSNVDQDGNKRKPATTNFDINKIRDMSNNIAYSQSGLRANPMGTAGQTSLANAYTPGSTKAWQNVVSWNTGRRFATGEPSGKHVYGNFSHLEDHPENDQAGIAGGAVAQTGPGSSDPTTAALQMAAAQTQKQQQANQDENAPTVAV